jgi:NADP-dependent 3-hydroxy acid dehydrogenase YdfG
MFDYSPKFVLLSGGSSGVGKSIAAAFAQASPVLFSAGAESSTGTIIDVNGASYLRS